MSVWGNLGDQTFWKNLEVNFGYGAVSKSTQTTQDQFNMISAFNSNSFNTNWSYFHTYAGYYAGLQNYVTGDSLSASNLGGFTTTPRALAGSIQASPNAIVA